MSILDLLRVGGRDAEALYPILFQHAGGVPAMAERTAAHIGGPQLLQLASHGDAALPYGMGAAAALGAGAIPALTLGLNASDPNGMTWDAGYGAHGRTVMNRLEAQQDALAARVHAFNDWRDPPPPRAPRHLAPLRTPLPPALRAQAIAEIQRLAPQVAIDEDAIQRQAQMIRLGLRQGGEPATWDGRR